MIVWHKQAQKAAQWVVDAVMGNGLAQQENEASDTAERKIAPGMPKLARRAAAEGCVLLTNDGTLPLSPADEVAVFGRCQLDWFAMGYGSGGDVHPPYSTNLMDGLAAAGARYNAVLAEVYRSWCASEEHAAENGFWGHWPLFHPEMPVSDELAHAAARTTKTAIVVIGRSAGEDRDLPLSPGGYYLTQAEKDLLATTVACFERVVVVLNVANAIDLSWVAELGDHLSAVLLAWQGGMEAGNAVADVLYGRVNPCGKLTCTIARSYDAYPSSASFGATGEVAYTEGVFVGYRHFDTYAARDVLFRFGHGLSYTTFALEGAGLFFTEVGGCTRVHVQNTGPRAGREVVQLWCEQPKGALQKPARVLVAFAKTSVLEPGASETVKLAFSLRDLAVYDKTRHAFVADPGSYAFFANDVFAGSIELTEEQVVERCHDICLSSSDLRERILAHLPSEVTRKKGGEEAGCEGSAKGAAGNPPKAVTFDQVFDGSATLEDFVSQLSDPELEALTCGEGAMNSKFGVPGNAGAFGGVTAKLRERGVAPVICADGPSGLRLQRRCSQLPSATTLACTWDTGLVRELYHAVGEEARAAGVDMLLGPGMNIQRNPLCGRNFEYFSEDPLLTGRMAAAVVTGLQEADVSACPKHFACNNQERRRNTSDSRVDERTLREIYLRGFEICVREAHPHAIMTSYNKINGVWAHYHFDLTTTVLRDEWEFAGVVITDWWMRPARSPEFPRLRDNAYRVRAGVDVLMPGSMSHVLPVFERPRGVTRGELQQAAKHVLGCVLQHMGPNAPHEL